MELTISMDGSVLRDGEEQQWYAQNGSVDLKGNPVLKSKRGGWKACSFLVVYEVFERMAYYGISSNLVVYLTTKLHQGTVEASNNVTNWVGTVFLTPILGAFIADAYLGRYWTFVYGSVIYIMGMLLLVLAVSIPPLKPPHCTSNCEPASSLQLATFFGGLYILAVGNGGAKATISIMGADQFDDFDAKERRQKLSFFNWWLFSIFLGTLFANSIIIYMQDNVGMTVGYGIPLLGLVISLIVFLVGTTLYRHKVPQGSPITVIARVIVAALRKWKVPLPADQKDLYELNDREYKSRGHFMIDSTPHLRFLSKAAVNVEGFMAWMLCPVTYVEETKQILKLIPFLVSMIIPSVIVSQVNTLFIKQGITLNRHMGPNFEIPAGSLQVFVTITMLFSLILYDRYFMRLARAWTKNPRGITLLQRVGIGLILQIITMVIASLTEKWRLSIARRHGLDQKPGTTPATIFMLLPQFLLFGVSDAFFVVGNIEFFYDQAPESMKSLGSSCAYTALGLGSFLSSFILKTVSAATKKRGNGWVLNNLNASHLDYYYAFLTSLNVLNFVCFLCISKSYTYRAETFEYRKHNVKEEEK